MNLLRGKQVGRLREHRRVVEEGDQGGEEVLQGERRRQPPRTANFTYVPDAGGVEARPGRRLRALCTERDHRRRRVPLDARHRRRAAGRRHVLAHPVAAARRVALRPDLRRRAEEHRPGGPHHRHRARGPASARRRRARRACSTTSCRPTPTRCSTRRRPTRIYIAGLVFKWLQAAGRPRRRSSSVNVAKAQLLYDYLDSSEFFRNPVAKEDRSRMNVPFTLRDAALDERVPQEARGARAGAAEGPPLGRRHARLDLQRDADRGRAKRWSTTCGSSRRSMARGRCAAFEILVLNHDLAGRA